jgi:hypothetical protein
VTLETIQESVPEQGVQVEPRVAASMGAASLGKGMPTRQSLPPKGSCWYCEKPLDSVRRFCGKGCADSFDEEAEYTR